MSLKVKPSILQINAYQQGKSDIAGVAEPIKLSSNESSFGPSPKAKEAYLAQVNNLHRYPDGGQTQLREAIADVYDLPAQQIICGSGSEELIQLLIKAYTCEGDEVLLSENGFVMCQIHALANGANVVIAPEKDYLVDVDAILQRVTDKTRIVIIANPNNPTGTYIPQSEIARLHAALPKNILLLLDAAYAEYVIVDDYDCGKQLVADNENVVVTRTFSKIYGLSGLRIGWMYCPQSIVDIIQRIRTPFNTNSAALAAATVAVRDIEFTEMVRQHNYQSLLVLKREISQLGIKFIDSVTNFYLLSFAQLQDKSAYQAAKFLESKGIIPRPAGNKDDDYLRITVGFEEENQAVIKTLKEYINQ